MGVGVGVSEWEGVRGLLWSVRLSKGRKNISEKQGHGVDS